MEKYSPNVANHQPVYFKWSVAFLDKTLGFSMEKTNGFLHIGFAIPQLVLGAFP